MIKVLADQVLAFDNGEKDRTGKLIQVKTTIGFCELPDWVEDHEYFQMAKKAGIIKPFKDSSRSEDVLKDMERKQALEAEIKELEEKRDMLAEVGKTKRTKKVKEDGTPETDSETATDEEAK